MRTIVVSGRSGTDHNARQMADSITTHPLARDRTVILVGYSKGGLDILRFLVDFPGLAAGVDAVVAVATPVFGTPLADLAQPAYSALVAKVPYDECPPGDGQVIASLQPAVSTQWLAGNPLPSGVRYYSLAAFTTREHVARSLVPLWRHLGATEVRNDGQVVVSDAVIPGSTLLALVNADHWGVAQQIEALEMAAIDPGLKVTLEKLSYLGGICTPSLLFVFVLEYIESPGWLTWRNAVLLAVIPLIAALLTWTNEWHSLMWSSIAPDPRLPSILVYTPGPGHKAVMAYDYLLGLIGIYLLVKAWRQDLKHFRSRLAMILLSMLFPLLAGILEVIGPPLLPGLELSPLSFSISGLVLAYGIFNHQLFTILPIARDLLIENMREGVLVLDGKNRVVDINRAAQNIIGISAVDIIGRSASFLPDGWPEAVMHGGNVSPPSKRA